MARTCVYGVAIADDGRVLVADARGKFVLPGGGIEAGESELDAVVRESLEETGYGVSVGALLGRAQQWINKPDKAKYRDKTCGFYRMVVVGGPVPPSAAGYTAHWLHVDDARRRLHYGSHRWAVDLASEP